MNMRARSWSQPYLWLMCTSTFTLVLEIASHSSLAAGEPRVILRGHVGSVFSVAFAPDGQTLASGGEDNTVRIWDVTKGRLITTLDRHTEAVMAVGFVSDGKSLASGSADGTIRLWDAETWKQLSTFHANAGIRSIAFSPRDHLLACATLRTREMSVSSIPVQLWDVSARKYRTSLRGHKGSVWRLTFSPDGRTLAVACGDETIILWDFSIPSLAPRVRATLKGHRSEVRSVAFSPDARPLASGEENGQVILWDARSGRIKAMLHRYSDTVWCVCFSPDGRLLASSSHDRTATLWSISKKKEASILLGEAGESLAVAFSPDGRTLATANSNGTITLWDVATLLEQGNG